MRWPRSLAVRLALATGLWVAAGLGAAAWFVADIAVRQVEAAFDGRLAALLDAVVAAAATSAEGGIVLSRAPAGADFERPFSGAYWQVTAPDGAVRTSRSLWDQVLPPAAAGHQGVLLRDVTGPRNERLRVAERDLLLPGASAPAHVAVGLSRAGTEADIARLRRTLLVTFAVLGLGLVGGVVATVVAGLAPLRRVRQALADVRQGRRARFDMAAPSEIAPLVAELDALVSANRATVERARSHVGNLAHALKTPLAVLRNALDAAAPDLPVARTEAAALERLVHHHLARARTTALASTTTGAAPFEVATQIATAMRRLFAERGLAIAVTGDPVRRVRVDPQDLTEMLGNLMENACTHARSRVAVSVAEAAAGNEVAIAVADDGPGLSEAELEQARRRGVRLDEAAPGSGLGLAIAADLAALHGGRLDLGRAPEGGLRAALHLPAQPLPQTG
ncbi:sensor histidine kinase [Roseomonas sp. AR75]|uniref:sensor histidine kinase n=1 Tax=Roseomonas sp. AR75 TaxID=2562311 RepID=UPI0010C140A0|nr:HAMP domain-containing sensor histidine kinase [Roseomonas sp. AR75]